MEKVRKTTARHKAAIKKHAKRAGRHVTKRVKPTTLALIMRVIAVVLLVALLTRPIVSNATAIHVKYEGCVAVTSRKLSAKENQTIRFKVTSQTDDTFIMEKFHIKRELKANKPVFIKLKAAAPSAWYEYKLEQCSFKSFLGIVNDEGKDPPMIGVGHNHEPAKEDRGEDHQNMQH
jgi:hypothetical protein